MHTTQQTQDVEHKAVGPAYATLVQHYTVTLDDVCVYREDKSDVWLLYVIQAYVDSISMPSIGVHSHARCEKRHIARTHIFVV